MDLAYRVIDSQTIQVTSPEALQAELDVEFYPLEDRTADDETTASLVQRLRERMGPERLDQAGAVLHLDGPGQHLIAALPQPCHRDLGRLLDQIQTP
jgi:hypothetical protein